MGKIIDKKELSRETGEQSCERARGEYQGCAAIASHGLDSAGGVCGIERDVATAGFQDGELCGDQLWRAVKAEGDGSALMRQMRSEEAGEAVRLRIELRVGERAGGGAYRDDIRGPCGTSLEEAVDGSVAGIFDRTTHPGDGRRFFGNMLSLSHPETAREAQRPCS